MRQVMVRYRVKPDRVEENEELVRAVYGELRLTEPAGLRYATFKLDDGVSFVHLSADESESEASPLSKVKAFPEFQRDIEAASTRVRWSPGSSRSARTAWSAIDASIEETMTPSPPAGWSNLELHTDNGEAVPGSAPARG